jgi:hypothetical protein
MKNDLKARIDEIESKYPVGTIEYEGIKIWPFIRSAIFLAYLFSEESITKKDKTWDSIYLSTRRIFRVLTTMPLSTLVKKNASVLFTDDAESELRYIDGKLVDIFAVPVMDYVKDIIPVVSKTRASSITAFPQYINSDFFSIWAKLYSCIKKIDKKKIINRQILVEIVSNLEIQFDIDKYILSTFSFIAIFRLYFKKMNPKDIFLICYYGIDKMAASYVAKEMKIPVIELQHGLIYNAHPPYVTKVNIAPNPYPDYLFCFGEEFKKFVSPFIYNSKNIFIVGNYYIDYIKKNKYRNNIVFLKKYNNLSSQIIVTVAGLTELDSEILEFVEKISGFRHDLFFIYIPRIMTSGFVHYSHKNIFIETELDVYQCMQNSHITSTVSSTCAIESLTFGTPVILMNIQNLAKAFYSDFFSPSDAVFYANTPEEYVSYIPDVINKDRKQIASSATYYYAENPQECTQKVFKKLSGKNVQDR